MFYVLSKVLYAFIAPSNLCLILLGTGLLGRTFRVWQKLSGRLVVAGFMLLLVFGFSPLGKWLAKPLDDRFAGVELPGVPTITHIVVLGGAELAEMSAARGQLSTNASAERLLLVPSLAKRYPAAKIVFTGGYGALLGDGRSAANDIRRHLIANGIAPGRILLESRSRTTWENAVLVRELLDQEKSTCPCGYLLVTSAWHMPRSVGAFRQVGFDEGGHRVYPWPVDYRTRSGRNFWTPFGWLHEGLALTDLAVKEWIGLGAYWISSRSSELWPGPARRLSAKVRLKD